MATDFFTSYEDVPYDSLPCTGSHPSKLAAMAAVMGLPRPPVERCRVLELGCGVGANALPIAADLPGAEVVAIDLSARQIEIATRAAGELGLRNLDLRQLDILDVGPDLGRFDYVIAHGIYAWVPAPVRDKVLAICAAHLTPHGLAYVSYNTLPGWHLTRVLRDFMLFHLRGVAAPAARATGIDEVFALLRDGVTAGGHPAARFVAEYAASYASALAGVGGNRSAAIHHDILAEVNQPVYVRDFAAHAARHGLQYLTDAGRWLGVPADLPPEVRARLDGLARDPVELQQYLDFLTMRTLRQTVLCRAEAAVAREPDPASLRELYVRSALKPVATHPELQGPKAERFAHGSGGSLKTSHPITKAALCHLAAEAPRPLRFDALVAAAAARLDRPAGAAVIDGADAQELGRMLLAAAMSDAALVFLEAAAPPVAHEAGPLPVARPLARWQLRATRTVTNHLHQPVTLEPLQAAVLERLDGSRDRAAILEALIAEAGATKVVRNGKVVPAHQLRAVLTRDLDATLAQLAQMALLSATA